VRGKGIDGCMLVSKVTGVLKPLKRLHLDSKTFFEGF